MGLVVTMCVTDLEKNFSSFYCVKEVVGISGRFRYARQHDRKAVIYEKKNCKKKDISSIPSQDGGPGGIASSEARPASSRNKRHILERPFCSVAATV